jgi:flagellar basal-body rod modification protein FlgD
VSINAITGLSSNSTTTTGTSSSSSLGKDAFLNLLLTQMKLQDPFDPMKNEDMIAQLAQFSSLEQLQSMNEGLQQSLDADLLLGQLLNNTMATTLIGKEVHVGTDTFERNAGHAVTLGYRLHADAKDVKVSVLDANGQVVATLKPTERGTGVHTVDWDGKDALGNELPSGTYTFKVEATGDGDTKIDAETLLVGRVSGIRYRDGNARVVLGDTEILMSAIEEILP